MTQETQSTERPLVAPPEVSYAVLAVSAIGFALWGLGWFALISDHEARLGWTLEFLGPLLIAIAIIMGAARLVARIGRLAFVLITVGALAGAFSTSIFALSPTNLETVSGIRFGYGAYGVGLLLGACALGAVLVRKEAELTAAPARSYPPCPVGCPCGNIIHASFTSLGFGAAGLLVWGLGFSHLATEPGGSEFGWVLSAVGSILVTIGLATHLAHLGARLGRAAVITAIASAVIWSLGYVMEAINPSAGVLSSWYTDLFICYGVGHLLTAISIVLVGRRKSALEAAARG